ncbi:hypothetical protein [Sciscionella marina]|uniref:hypothetical protein n=1 Tax=Sciscionella marina TaxID=508770 RepID=UPI0003744372|nr:hypothetical protein [Sciscionella marina]
MKGVYLALGLIILLGAGLAMAEIFGTGALRAEAQRFGERALYGARLTEVELHGFPRILQEATHESEQIDFLGETVDDTADIHAIASTVDLRGQHARKLSYAITVRHFAAGAQPTASTNSPAFALGDRHYRAMVARDGEAVQVSAHPEDQTLSDIGPLTVRLPFLPREARIGTPSVVPAGIRFEATVDAR